MSFREKTHWASLAAVIVAIVGYMSWYSAASAISVAEQIATAAAWLGLGIAVQIAAAIALAIDQSAKQRGLIDQLADERDRQFEQRSFASGYYVFVTGACVALASAFVSKALVDIANILIITILVAEIVRLTLLIVSYRRGF
jgi:MFS family permease